MSPRSYRVLRIFSHLIPEVNREAILGDWIEGALNCRQQHGLFAMVCWMIWQCIRSGPRVIQNKVLWSLSMWQKQWKLWWRHQRRQPLYAFLIWASLALGFWVVMAITLFIRDELSYDRHHSKADRIHRITMSIQITDVYQPHWARCAFEGIPALPDDIPEIESLVRFSRLKTGLIANEKKIFTEKLFFVDKNVFEVFNFPLIHGDSETALIKPRSLVLTQKEAFRLFNRTDVVGEIVEVIPAGGAPKQSYMVTGVLENLPEQTHLKFDYLIPRPLMYSPGSWAYTYVLLREGASPESVAEKLPEFISQHTESKSYSLYIQPMNSIHLDSNLDRELEANGSRDSLGIFAIIGMLVMALASMNFINLSTARAAGRAREIGMAKVLGAHRHQLIKAGLQEAIFNAGVAYTLAFIALITALPFLNSLTGKSLGFSDINHIYFWAGSLFIVVLVGVLAGCYPAVWISGFKPVEALQGKRRLGNGRFRRILVIFQFSISLGLIIIAGVIRFQSRYILNNGLGRHTAPSIAVPNLPQPIRTNFTRFAERLRANLAIDAVTGSMERPSRETLDGGYVTAEGVEIDQENPILIYAMPVDNQFYSFFDLELTAGRLPEPSLPGEEKIEYLLNEAAVKTIGWESPEDAIGRRFQWRQSEDIQESVIIGVVRDFHFSTLRKEIKPLTFFQKNFWLNCLLVRPYPGHEAEAIEAIRNIWSEFAPDHSFQWQYVDDLYRQLYTPERRLARLIDTFGILAVIIGALGLAGLASHAARQRLREMAIRKIMGARSLGIIKLFAHDVIIALIYANCIAWPIAWWASRKWLQNYAYRVDIPIWLFPLAGVLLFIVAIIASGQPVASVLHRSPVQTLRSE
ncbi:ABC transporter permease [bacterium]|nr:ABC transporter permease [bacterium]